MTSTASPVQRNLNSYLEPLAACSIALLAGRLRKIGYFPTISMNQLVGIGVIGAISSHLIKASNEDPFFVIVSKIARMALINLGGCALLGRFEKQFKIKHCIAFCAFQLLPIFALRVVQSFLKFHASKEREPIVRDITNFIRQGKEKEACHLLQSGDRNGKFMPEDLSDWLGSSIAAKQESVARRILKMELFKRSQYILGDLANALHRSIEKGLPELALEILSIPQASQIRVGQLEGAYKKAVDKKFGNVQNAILSLRGGRGLAAALSFAVDREDFATVCLTLNITNSPDIPIEDQDGYGYAPTLVKAIKGNKPHKIVEKLLSAEQAKKLKSDKSRYSLYEVSIALISRDEVSFQNLARTSIELMQSNEYLGELYAEAIFKQKHSFLLNFILSKADLSGPTFFLRALSFALGKNQNQNNYNVAKDLAKRLVEKFKSYKIPSDALCQMVIEAIRAEQQDVAYAVLKDLEGYLLSHEQIERIISQNEDFLKNRMGNVYDLLIEYQGILPAMISL